MVQSHASQILAQDRHHTDNCIKCLRQAGGCVLHCIIITTTKKKKYNKDIPDVWIKEWASHSWVRYWIHVYVRDELRALFMAAVKRDAVPQPQQRKFSFGRNVGDHLTQRTRELKAPSRPNSSCSLPNSESSSHITHKTNSPKCPTGGLPFTSQNWVTLGEELLGRIVPMSPNIARTSGPIPSACRNLTGANNLKWGQRRLSTQCRLSFKWESQESETSESLTSGFLLSQCSGYHFLCLKKKKSQSSVTSQNHSSFFLLRIGQVSKVRWWCLLSPPHTLVLSGVDSRSKGLQWRGAVVNRLGISNQIQFPIYIRD